MPVDLSRIGLEGHDAYYDHMYKQSVARSNEQNAIAQDLENKEAQQMLELNQQAAARLQALSQGRDDGPMFPDTIVDRDDSAAAPLEMVSDVYLRGGAIEQASKIMDTASQIRNRESEIRGRTVSQRQNELENVIKGADIVSRFAADATDQASWEAGWAELRATGVVPEEQMAALESIPYSPEAQQHFVELALSTYQQAQLENAALGRDIQERSLEATERDRSIRNARETARMANTERYRERVLKNQGSGQAAVGNTPAGVVKAVDSALRSQVDDEDLIGIDLDNASPEYKRAVDYIAGQAQRRIRENKALDQDTAIQQAILAAQADKTLEFGFRDAWGSDPKSLKLNQIGMTRDRPILATGLKKEDLIPGRWYKNNGRIARFTGEGFEQ